MTYLERQIEMVLLLTALISTTQLGSPKQAVDGMSRLEMLAFRRGAFEGKLPASSADRIYAMAMGPGNVGFYPVGVSSHRYLLRVLGGPPMLLCQSIHGMDAKADWSLKLKSRRGPKPRSGTLRILLWNSGYSIGTKHLSAVQKASLAANGAFAAYTCHGPVFCVGYFRSDGAEANWDAYWSPEQKGGGLGNPPRLPITAEEAVALGLGNRRWHGLNDPNIETRKPRGR